MKPKKVVSKLREVKKIEDEGLDINYEKVKRYCHHQKIKYYKKNLKNTVAELDELLKSFSFDPALKDEEMFVLEKNLDLSTFNVIFSSKNLLKNALNQSQSIRTKGFEGRVPSFYHVDGTYKLLDAGFVTLVLGTENIYHQFRPIALSIVAHEDTESYEILFQKTREWINKLFDEEWIPKFALMDGAKAALNATKNVFGETKVILCWFHMLKAIRNHIYNLKPSVAKNHLKENWAFICYGLGLLAKTRSQKQLLDLWRIIRDDWEKALQLDEDFVLYIEGEYIKSKFTWNQSTFLGKSRTNNSVESFNNVLKQTYFESKRFDVISFFNVAKRMIKDFSLDMTEFPITLELSVFEWHNGLLLSKTAILNLKKNAIGYIKKEREAEKKAERER